MWVLLHKVRAAVPSILVMSSGEQLISSSAQVPPMTYQELDIVTSSQNSNLVIEYSWHQEDFYYPDNIECKLLLVFYSFTAGG